MNLHQQMIADLTGVFFNLDEFACEHLFQGKKLVCIVDDQLGAAQSAAADGFADASSIGLLQCDRVVFCKAEDLDELPLPDSQVEMDGKFWLVGPGVTEAEGMVTMPLNRAF